jgi:hypothetical protein
MLLALIAAVLLAAGGPQTAERSRAEALARSGQTEEAIQIFKRIVEKDPADTDAQLWIARLDMRLGHTDEAAARYREVLKTRPRDVDARIGLGGALLRQGQWREALELLQATEPDAGQNGDLFVVLARAYRRAGDDQRGYEYYSRAHELSPADPEIQLEYERAMRGYGHWIGFEGFTEAGAGTDRASGTVSGAVRVTPRFRLQGSGRVQSQAGASDAIGGAGAEWRVSRNTTLAFQALGGSGNTSLANLDVAGGILNYVGAVEVGASVRGLSFAGTDVVALSPLFAWDRDRWRLDARYTYSRSQFDATGQTSGDHSVMLRETWRGWRRVWLQGTYAYGIESFEQLTADRVGSLGSTTLAGAVRLLAPAFDITTTFERQFRSNDTGVNRLTIAFVQYFK